jgi:tetratricopeptide (TPR) repeat protein
LAPAAKSSSWPTSRSGPPTPSSREAVATNLWPETDPSTARKNLSFNLFMLKKRLSEVGIDDAVEEHRKTLRVAPTIDIDAVTFGEDLAAAATTSSVTDRVIHLEHAVGLYGAGLLPDMDYAWLAPQQARFESLFRDTISLLARTTQTDSSMQGIIEHIPPTAWQTVARRSGLNKPATAPIPPVPEVPLPAIVDLPALVAFAREAETGLRSEVDRARWLDRIAERQPQIEAAVRRVFEEREYAIGFGILVPLWRYWQLRGDAGVAQRWLQTLLAAPYSPPVRDHARALHAAGTLAYYSGQRQLAKETLSKAIAIWQRLDDAGETLRSLTNLAIAQYGLGELDEAHETYAQCIGLAEGLGKEAELGTALINAAICEIGRGDAAQGRSYLERRLALLGGEQAPPSVAMAVTMAHLASIELLEGNLAPAAARAAQAKRISESLGDDRGRALAARLLGRIAYHQGELAGAETLMAEAVAAARESNSLWELGSSLGYLSIVLEAAGKVQVAASTMWHAVTVLRATGDAGSIDRFTAELAAVKESRGGGTSPA